MQISITCDLSKIYALDFDKDSAFCAKQNKLKIIVISDSNEEYDSWTRSFHGREIFKMCQDVKLELKTAEKRPSLTDSGIECFEDENIDRKVIENIEKQIAELKEFKNDSGSVLNNLTKRLVEVEKDVKEQTRQTKFLNGDIGQLNSLLAKIEKRLSKVEYQL